MELNPTLLGTRSADIQTFTSIQQTAAACLDWEVINEWWIINTSIVTSFGELFKTFLVDVLASCELLVAGKQGVSYLHVLLVVFVFTHRFSFVCSRGKCKSGEFEAQNCPKECLPGFAMTDGLWRMWHVSLPLPPHSPARHDSEICKYVWVEEWGISSDVTVRCPASETSGRNTDSAVWEPLFSRIFCIFFCVFSKGVFFSPHLLNQTRTGGAIIAVHLYSTSKWHKEQYINCVIWIQFSRSPK